MAKVYDAYPGAVHLKTHALNRGEYDTSPYGIIADIEAGTEEAWPQMTGVKLALSVTIEGSPQTGPELWNGTINRILGIEQPLRTPGSNGRSSVKSGNREVGYIHGTVLENTTPSCYYRTALLLGRETARSALICSSTFTTAVRGAEYHESPQAGDIIRAYANRLTMHHQDYQQEQTLLHILGQVK